VIAILEIYPSTPVNCLIESPIQSFTNIV
jgi:hypothetical protein